MCSVSYFGFEVHEAHFPSGLKLSQFPLMGMLSIVSLSLIGNLILIRTLAPSPALMDQLLIRGQILLPIRILNLMVSQAAVESPQCPLQREPKKTRLWTLCEQRRTEAFGVWVMFAR